MKLLKHKEERQCTGVSDYPCFLIPAPICCPLNLIHRQSVQDWVEEASLGILPTRPEMKTSYASWEIASTGRRLSKLEETEIWLGFSSQTIIAKKPDVVPVLGIVLLALGVQDKSQCPSAKTPVL